MKINDLLKEREEIKFRLRGVLLRIDELRQTYFPSGKGGEKVTKKSSTSPQEMVVVMIDTLERKAKSLESQLEKIDENIEIELGTIVDPKARWIVFRKITGSKWQKISDECCYSVSHIKRIYKETMDNLKELDK